ncbi:MAG TPA: glycosyltransferase [Acetivibrio sp.]|nr:glycosyltransferase [Acetivibrio sp.]
MMEKLYSNITFKDDHIFRLTDDTGMLQHSKYSLPDPNHGYTADDNARALIMALMLYEKYKEKKYLDLVYRYASFLLYAQNESGWFKNFMGYDRKWLEERGSEDCFGRCMWALGYALSNDNTPKGVKQGLSYILKNALPNVAGLNWLRSKAYSIIGLAGLEDKDAASLVFQIAQSLCRRYDEHRDGDWKWFENVVTYCNSVLPWSLIAAYRVTGEKRFWDVAEESLEFLESITFKDGYFKPVGCDGWLSKGEKPAEFDEQPVEACEVVLTYMEAYEATHNEQYLQKAKKCYAWYEGANSKGISLIDSETGGCYDGLTPKGVNLNMGAESLVSYIISYMKISEVV